MEDACDICGQNSIISVCKNCSIKGCDRCINDHLSFCEHLRNEKCHFCKDHHYLIKGYCGECRRLTCKECAIDNHFYHPVKSIMEGIEYSKSDFVAFKEAQSKISSYYKTCMETLEIYQATEERIEEAEEEYQKVFQRVKAEFLSKIEMMKGQIEQQCEANEKIRPYLDLPNITAESFPILFLAQFSEARLYMDEFQRNFMRYDVIPTDDLNSIQNIHKLFLNRMMELAGPKESSTNTSDMTGIDSPFSGVRNQGIGDEANTESRWKDDAVPDNEIEDLNVKVNKMRLQISELEAEKAFMIQCLEQMLTLVHQINDTKELGTPFNFAQHENETLNWFIRSVEFVINKMVQLKSQLIQSEADLQTKIAEMTTFSRDERRGTSNTQIEPNLTVYQQDIYYKEGKIKCLEEQLHHLKLKDCQLEQKAYKMQFDCAEQLHTVEQERNDLKIMLETANDTIIQREQEMVALQNEMQRISTVFSQKDDFINTMKREKDDIQNRLSKIAGEKLTKGNPAITDLGDPKRPMKLAEMYGGLYDNEWTDAMECSGVMELFLESKNPDTEEIIVRHLYKIVSTCYEECLQLSKEQYINIAQIIQYDSNQGESNISSLPGCIDLASIRKQNSDKFVQYLLTNKILHEKILTSPWDYTEKNRDLMKQLIETPFFAKCVHLCWLMVLQEPAIYLSENLLPDTVYDKNVYKEFVQSGDKVTYVVWPALFLHKNGPLLYKGVVQAHK